MLELRTNEEVAAEALRRAEASHKRRRYRRRWLAGTASAAACFLLVGIALTLLWPDGLAIEPGQALASVTMIGGAGAGGYVLAGVVGFSLGIATTLASLRARRRKQPKSDSSSQPGDAKSP